MLVLACLPVQAQQHGGHQLEHEKFYKDWLMPDVRSADGERQRSCCNDKDCYPTTGYQDENGDWWARRRENGVYLKIPRNKVEHNYPDGLESPDGSVHMCAHPPGVVDDAPVLCFVVGDGA